jgi:hypothetical protein
MVFKPFIADAYFSIRCNCQFDSNVTDVSDVPSKKQALHTTPTEGAISMFSRSLPSNADSSIRRNFQCDSNVTNISDVQPKGPERT